MGTAKMLGRFPITKGTLLIGHDGIENNGMAGLMQKVYLHKRALDEKEIKELL